MIELTSINGKTFYLNSSLIYRIDKAPESIITTSDGQKIMVKESAEEIAQLFLDYQRKIIEKSFLLDN